MEARGQMLRVRLRPMHRRIAAALPFRLRRLYLYLASVRRIPRVRRPVAFTEKMNWRILEDRRPGIAERCDKLRMKELARELVPGPELRIPETYWSGTDLADVPAEIWERDWVLKPNHSSGRVILSDDPRPREEIARVCREWLEEDLSLQLGEWGYSSARKLLVLEERIPSAGSVPPDHKVYLFDGDVQMIQIDVDRFGNGTRNIYDADWRPIPVWWNFPRGEEVPPPAALERLLGIARRLGAGWDHMRVDLYLHGEDVWFGEFSPYSQGGMMRFHPAPMDRTIGDWWRLPELPPEHRARRDGGARGATEPLADVRGRP